MKTPSFQVQDYREELHPYCRAEELIEDRIIGVCRYSFIQFSLGSLHSVLDKSSIIYTRFGFDEFVFGFTSFLKTSFESIYYICFEYRVFIVFKSCNILAISCFMILNLCFRVFKENFQSIYIISLCIRYGSHNTKYHRFPLISYYENRIGSLCICVLRRSYLSYT